MKFYKVLNIVRKIGFTYSVNRNSQFSGNSVSPILIDSFGRKHSYLRISLTERCNLRCQYCMPEEGVALSPKSHLLSTDEVIILSSLFAKLGVSKIRFTGGEPLIRKDLTQIIKYVSELEGVNTTALTTNGLTLHYKIDELKEAGLNALNISLDTLVPAKFEFITRMKGFKLVLKSIDSALEKGFDPVKLNCVVMRGFNDDELVSFVKLAECKNLDVRFIEYSPFGGNKWKDSKLVSYQEMLDRIKVVFPHIQRIKSEINDTSKAYKVPGFKGQFGFITSMTENFCNSCNRLRITADGNLKVCLFGKEEISLRDVIRHKVPEETVLNIIANAVMSKKKQHAGVFLQTIPLYDKYKPDLFLISNNSNSLPKSIAFFSTFTKKAHHLTHTNHAGKVQMVDVGMKSNTLRIAEAEACIHLGPLAFQLLKENRMKKGDVLSTATIAGIMAAKKTSDIIPLCHNINLNSIEVTLTLNEPKYEVLIKSQIKTTSNTGVEMEALTAVTVAALTVYDMCKAVSKEMVIKSVRLLLKTGGKSDFKKC